MVAFDPQGSTAALNAAGYIDSPAGRASYSTDTGATSYPAASTVQFDANGRIVSSNPGGSSSSSGSGSGNGQLANTNAANQLLGQAQQAAYQAYLNARLNLETDAQAFTQAQQAFTNKINEASLTGSYNGQQTQAAQQQKFQQNFDVQQEQDKTALGYLGVIAGLKAPQDYGQYLRTLASTPGGLGDLVSSAAGRYVPGTGATTGVQPVPATLGGLLAQVPTTGAMQTGGVAGAPQVQPAQASAQTTGGGYTTDQLAAIDNYMNQQIGSNNWAGGRFHADVANGVPIEQAIRNAAQGAGGVAMDPSRYTLPQIPQPSQAAPVQQQAVQQPQQQNPMATTTASTVGQPSNPAAASYAQYQQAAAGLPAPNQISAAAWNSYTDSQKKLLLGMYQNQGWQTQDVQDLYNQSLPKYSYSGAGTVKLG